MFAMRRRRPLTAQRRHPRDRDVSIALSAAVRAELVAGGTGRKALGRSVVPARKAKPTLVIAEKWVDGAVARAYIAAIEQADAYGEVPALSDSIGTDILTPASAVGGRSGTADDEDLGRAADRLASDLCDAVGRALGEQREWAGLDTADALRFVLGDVVLEVGRAVRPLARLVRSGRYGAVVFIASTGRLIEALLPVAEECIDPRDVHVFWAPEVKAKSAPPPQDPMQVDAAPAATPPPASPIAFLIEPRARMTREFSRIVAEVTNHHHVAVVGSSDQLKRHSGSAGHLRALVDSKPGRAAFVAPDLNVAEPPPVVGNIVNTVLADPAIAELRIDGVRLQPLLYPVVRHALELWREARQFAVGFDAFVRESSPHVLVVCPDRTPIARLACRIARQHGVVSLYPVTGLISASSRYKALQADFGCLMDDSQVHIHEAMHPEDRGKLFADGLPELDHVAAASRRRKGSPSSSTVGARRRVALLLQPMPEAYNAQLIGLAQEAAAASDAVLTVRTHPYELASSRQRFADLLDVDSGSSLDEGTLVDLLERADLAVGGFSTALIEAAILGVPVVAVNLTGTPFPLSLGELGIATEVDDPQNLRAAVQALLTDEHAIAAARGRQNDYFERNPHLRDGAAAERVAHRIVRLARLAGADAESASGGEAER